MKLFCRAFLEFLDQWEILDKKESVDSAETRESKELRYDFYLISKAINWKNNLFEFFRVFKELLVKSEVKDPSDKRVQKALVESRD